MTELKDVTVVIIDCVNQGKAINAITKTLQQINPVKTLFFTDTYIEVPDVETIVIKKICSKTEYSYFVMKQLSFFVKTDFILTIQHDGYVLDGELWGDEFYNYDYIGARWNYPEGERAVGNGGFSFRSRKLMNAIALDKFIEPTELEDECICRLYGNYLERTYKTKFGTNDIAEKFSFELREPCNKTFGFHGYFWEPFKEHIVIKRTGATGDLIMTEPVIQYFHDKGYEVVLDTLENNMGVFFNHPFRVFHISEMNPKIKPLKVINLDMSYESKPKQNVLKTYYEFAGITDMVMRNSRLYLNMNKGQKLFLKYIVFHIDNTGMKYRNVYGVNWTFVNNYYSRLGYTVIQIGLNEHENVGTYFHAETKQTTLYLLKGADAVCGIDSGIAQMSVALGVPTAIFTGNVNLKLRYHNFENIQVIKNPCPQPELEYCYHNEISVEGCKCAIDNDKPPCTANFSEWQVIEALNKLLKLN